MPAQLVGIAVPVHPRRRGFGHRLLTGALMLLRAEGFEWVQARAAPGGAGASPLACAAFTADPVPTRRTAAPASCCSSARPSAWLGPKKQ